MNNGDSLTKRLRLFMKGDTAVVDSLVREIMPELYRVAASHLKNERYIAPLTSGDGQPDKHRRYQRGLPGRQLQIPVI